jgi:hypothetical protein
MGASISVMAAKIADSIRLDRTLSLRRFRLMLREGAG